jgi:hypothetical protein
MDSKDVRILLAMVKKVDKELDLYLAGGPQPINAIAEILETCEQMRTRKLDGAVTYSLDAIERYAGEIANPRNRSETDGHFLACSDFLGLRLLKELYKLHTQLTGARTRIARFTLPLAAVARGEEN